MNMLKEGREIELAGNERPVWCHLQKRKEKDGSEGAQTVYITKRHLGEIAHLDKDIIGC